MLSRSESVSFNDLLRIKGVARIIFAAVQMQMNNMIADANLEVAFSHNPTEKQYKLSSIFNIDFSAGILLVIIGFISKQKQFTGLRITLVLLCIVFVTVWNIIWMSFSEIREHEIEN